MFIGAGSGCDDKLGLCTRKTPLADSWRLRRAACGNSGRRAEWENSRREQSETDGRAAEAAKQAAKTMLEMKAARQPEAEVEAAEAGRNIEGAAGVDERALAALEVASRAMDAFAVAQEAAEVADNERAELEGHANPTGAVRDGDTGAYG